MRPTAGGTYSIVEIQIKNFSEAKGRMAFNPFIYKQRKRKVNTEKRENLES